VVRVEPRARGDGLREKSEPSRDQDAARTGGAHAVHKGAGPTCEAHSGQSLVQSGLLQALQKAYAFPEGSRKVQLSGHGAGCYGRHLRPYPSQVRQVIQSFPLHNRGIHVRYEEFFYPSLGRGQEDIHPLWVQLGPEVPHKPLWRGIFQRDFQCFSRRDPAYGARRGMRLGKAALLSGHKGENMLCHDRAGYTKSAPPASATSVRSLLRARENPSCS
jgi:hypothetical protein